MAGNDIVLIEGARTAFTEFGGSFKDVSAIDLGVIASKEAMTRSGIKPEEVDQVVMGNVIQSSGDAVFLGRHIGLKSGIPQSAPGLTVNRLCGSGLQAIVSAAQSIRLGESQVALAGGAENMSQIPHVIRGARFGIPLGQAPMADFLWESLYDPYGDCTMSITAENIAAEYGITRESCDEFAVRSNERALAAIEKGYFGKEITPVAIKTRKGEVNIDRDEHPRASTYEKISKLKARFKDNGVVTAANASGINDGAAAVILTSADYAEKNNIKPLARLVSYGISGVDPKLMGLGPVTAIQQALSRAGMDIKDLDLVEINEAFAAQYLGCQKLLDFDPEIGNVNGGAVALGHPLGASGARISLSLIYELQRRGKKYGVSSLCIGGGQGIAAIWEAIK
ncbi:acetyl-CoA C-acetyltransferase [Peribacillus butanolivorans]|uniref:acetyl-CoA C-acetyltransferase n=1 Tax=Peribacillus butanolivorans TaxID=421767 RepID=A0ABM6XN59_9BACI|nr:acetyl-CoA C-acetyltransferase [Peribacillus butanolivorans]AXN39997.1 acetyl-CoA C-acetyltransferase [Peribacillus butanolivorans]QNU06115.1 acetyl-CoA C-acetyltransferase [Peribacillus butanolivorans]